MALKITDKTNVEAPNASYPYGQIQDESVSGANDGTPISRAVYGDIHQFFAKLMDEAGITPNSLPDNVDNGFQLFDAFKNWIIKLGQNELADKYDPMYLANGLRTDNVSLKEKIIEIGSWDMSSTSTVNVAHGIGDFKKIRQCEAFIINDFESNMVNLSFNNGLTTGLSTILAGRVGLIDTNVNLIRFDNGFFNSTSYDDSSINRGWIKITYEV